MKSYNSIYYLLAVMLILGGFASMAQNDYGMLILSGCLHRICVDISGSADQDFLFRNGY